MKCTVDKLRAREQLLWRSRLLILHISLNHYGPYVTPPDSPAPLQTKATESPCCTDSGAAAALSSDLWCVQLQVAEAERGGLIGTSKETCGVNDDAKCQVRWRVSWRSCRFLFLVQRTEKKIYIWSNLAQKFLLTVESTNSVVVHFSDPTSGRVSGRNTSLSPRHGGMNCRHQVCWTPTYYFSL